MSYRQLLINCECYIKYKDKQLIICREKQENQVPIDDINIIVLENDQISITSMAISELAKRNVVLLFCGSNHMPITMTCPLGQHYRPYDVFMMQINQKDEQKFYMSEILLKAKVANQRRLLELLNKKEDTIQKMVSYEEEIIGIDELNREGTAAKVYFNSLFGTDFKRFDMDDINAMLNYGYGVFRSAVARSLATYGFTLYIGVHHCGKENPLNLVYDIIEPFRPIVDYYVAENYNYLEETLSVPMRKEIVYLLNVKVLVSGKEQTVQNAIDLLVKSYLRFLEFGDMNIEIPSLLEINFDLLYEHL